MRIALCSLLFACLFVPGRVVAQDRPVMPGVFQSTVVERGTPTGVTGPIWAAATTHATASGRRFRSPSGGQGQPPRRHWVSRHPVLFGTLVGFGATAVAIGASCSGNDGGDIPCSTYMLGYGAVGAGIGAGIGLAVSALRR